MIGINFLRSSQKIDAVLSSAQPDETPGNIIRAISPDDFKTILSSGSVEQVGKLLDQVNNWNPSGSAQIRIAENQRRVEVASRLLQLPLSQELRAKAVKSKFDALSINYGIDFAERLNLTSIAPNLLAFADSHRNDPNPEIAQLAQLSTVKVEVFELLKQSSAVSKKEFQPIADQIVELMQKSPNDSQLLNDLKRTIAAVAGYSPEDGRVLIQILVSQANNLADPKIVDYLDSLNDDLMLIDSQFKPLFENRFVNGKSGQDELLACLMSLASNPAGRSKLLNTVMYGLNWFEEANHFEQAAEVYQAMLDSAQLRTSPAAATLAKDLGNAGLTRCQLVGKEWQFNGKPIRDLTWQQDLDLDQLKGRVVVVIFWSINHPDSLNVIRDFNTKALELSRKRVVVIAVCVDEMFDETFLRLCRNMRGYLFVGYPKGVDCVPPSEISMLEQCPVDRLPFAVVIDDQGIVRSVNVPVDELKSTIDAVVLKQLERP